MRFWPFTVLELLFDVTVVGALFAAIILMPDTIAKVGAGVAIGLILAGLVLRLRRILRAK